ncbi:unnamed protein product [Sphenostylis stenocarpa]|uniref:Uncharacterized protein n=1 Tax=Sphenostylis stenocarpa TaxID=92480 RepID=A0AA86T5G1_9FABA|nr:unnamed protein product [Sphenostylis stenocarpa]
MDGRLARVDGRLPPTETTGRPSGKGGRSSAPNGPFWTAICLKRTGIYSFFLHPSSLAESTEPNLVPTQSPPETPPYVARSR